MELVCDLKRFHAGWLFGHSVLKITSLRHLFCIFCCTHVCTHSLYLYM